MESMEDCTDTFNNIMNKKYGYWSSVCVCINQLSWWHEMRVKMSTVNAIQGDIKEKN